jgi:hypothetical protein
MRVKLCKTIGDPQPKVLEDINLVILEDGPSGSPISVACEYQEGSVREVAFSNVTDDDFKQMLKNLGISKLCVCEQLQSGKDHS